MMGVETLSAEGCAFQATFSSSPHFTGSPVSVLTPLPRGPRHWGQFSANAALVESIRTIQESLRMAVPLRNHFILSGSSTEANALTLECKFAGWQTADC